MLWSGRFSKSLNQKVFDFTNSLSLDTILYPYDIAGSLVHIQTMNDLNVITDDEFIIITEGLKSIKTELDEATFDFKPTDEDIHMAIERRLIESIGDVGKKLHTGRSRNDQVALDVRMFLKDEIKYALKHLDILIQNLIDMAEKNLDIIMPGYTHLQQAQPILFSHYILAYANKFRRDKERFKNAFKSTDIYPLGSGALAGTPYKVNREKAAKDLGFSSISTNSIDVVSDRDFMLDYIYAASTFALHCSRLAEDFIIYSSSEFNFIEMDDAYTTGSSIMPQKKNPDIMELIRGRSQRNISSLSGLFNVMKGLPLTYNRDMQDDKVYLLQTINNTADFLEILPEAIRTTKIKKENMLTSLGSGFLYATAIADYLVTKNIPFRKAHEITGSLVAYCIDSEKTFVDLDLTEFKKIDSIFESDILKIFAPITIVNKQVIDGGTSLKSVKQQIKNFRF
ncbi:MAG: argininosuccinate lyase [bacterium]|nr:argininosuccinate lyase [bacterium]